MVKKRPEINLVVLPQEPGILIELGSFIAFLRDSQDDKPEDKLHADCLCSIADFLAERHAELKLQKDEILGGMESAGKPPSRAPTKGPLN